MTKICSTINLSPLELNNSCTRCMPISVQPLYWGGKTSANSNGFISSSGEIYKPSTGRVAVDMPLYCAVQPPPGSPASFFLGDSNPMSIRVVGPNPNNTIFYKLPNGYSQTYNVTSPWLGCGNSKFQYVADPANSLGLKSQSASMWVIESKEHPTKPLSFNPGVVTVEIKDFIGGTTKFETLEVSDYDNTLVIPQNGTTIKIYNKVLPDGIINACGTGAINFGFEVGTNWKHTLPSILATLGFVDKGTHFETRIYRNERPFVLSNCVQVQPAGRGTRIDNIEVDYANSTYPHANLFSTFFDNTTQMWKLKIVKLNGAMPPDLTANQDIFFTETNRISTFQNSAGAPIGVVSYTRNNLVEIDSNNNLSTYPIIPEC